MPPIPPNSSKAPPPPAAAMTPILRPSFDAGAVQATVLGQRDARGPSGSVVAVSTPAALEAVHQRWLAGLRAARLRTAQGRYVAVWLEPGIEHEIDAAWSGAPSQAIWLHALAATLCMQAVALLVPEVVGHGCAPVPRPDPELPEALRQAGLRPERQYTVVTAATWPERGGGCAGCALATPAGECPQRNVRAQVRHLS